MNKFDKSKARAMYDAGWTDREIAEEQGVSTTTVCVWRKADCLPPNRKEKPRQNEGQKQEPVADRGAEESVRLYRYVTDRNDSNQFIAAPGMAAAAKHILGGAEYKKVVIECLAACLESTEGE